MAVCVLYTLTAFNVLIRYLAVQRIADGQTDQALYDQLDITDAVAFPLSIISIVAFVLHLISFMMWTFRYAGNMRRLGVQRMEYTPGWSVGWFFIPIANFWKPFSVFKELWNVGQNLQDWRNNPAPNLLVLWWFFFVAQMIADRIVIRLYLDADDVNSLLTAQITDMMTIALTLISFMLTMNVISRMTRVQNALISNHSALPDPTASED